MKESGFAKQDDLNFHKKEDWHSVHGLWPQIKDYLDRNIPRYHQLATPVSLAGSMTGDGAWHDLDLTSNTSSTCFKVKLLCRLSESGNSRWVMLYTRKKGSSANYEGGFALELEDSVPGSVKIKNFVGEIDQGVDTGQVLEYKRSNEGTLEVYLVAYWDYAA